MEATVIIPEKTDISKNLAYEKYRIDPMLELPEPPVIISHGDTPIMTEGNFSMLMGKAKSGKTFLLGLLVGTLLGFRVMNGILNGKPNPERNVALYIDTEQSSYHATRTLKRICDLIGDPNPQNLIAYGLRPMSPADRLLAIEEMIKTTKNLRLLVIDGARDLLTSGINDEAEATNLTSKFLKWTHEYKIHLIVLLHQNKNDANPRGHIGTELLNKAETTISVNKQKSGVFVVSFGYSRDIETEDFAFVIKDGLPVYCDVPPRGQIEKKEAEMISDEEYSIKLKKIFKNSNELGRQSFKNAIRNSFSIGDTYSRKYINHILLKKWVTRERVGKKINYKFNEQAF